MNALRLNMPRGTKTDFLTSERYNTHPCPVCMGVIITLAKVIIAKEISFKNSLTFP